MSSDFLTTHRLYLTPLSPLHLGCGEDYLPTNYVIAEGLLYAFDPAKAKLNNIQRQDLQKTNKADLKAIQKFFNRHQQAFIACAHATVDVTPALQTKYTQYFQQNTDPKQFTIKRIAAHPHTHAPYIPGSAVKGCIRTAVLETLSQQYHKNHPNAPSPKANEGLRYEAQLLGSFATDGLRLLKTADLMPSAGVFSQIQYAANLKRNVPENKAATNSAKGGIPIWLETIPHGQYRAFCADFVLQHLPDQSGHPKGVPAANVRPHNLQQLAQQTNAYHLPRFEKENKLLAERGMIDPAWWHSSQVLLAALKPALDQGHIMLLRLGKHGGAECKTLKIKIGKSTIANTTKTVWLAAPGADDTKGLLPFGWALIEIDPAAESPPLQQWRDENHTHLQHIQTKQAALRHIKEQAAAAEREAAAAEQRRKEQAEALAAEQARQAAAAAAHRAAMSPAERLIHDWQQALQNFRYDGRNQQEHTNFYQKLLTALQQAANDFDPGAQQHIAAELSLKKMQQAQPQLFSSKREKEIKALLRQLRGE